MDVKKIELKKIYEDDSQSLEMVEKSEYPRWPSRIYKRQQNYDA